MSIHLTEGALKKILCGEHVEQPILKILGRRWILDQDKRRSCQLFITDNINYTSLAILDLNFMLIEILYKLKKNYVAQIINYSINHLNNEGKQIYVMVIKEMNVMSDSSGNVSDINGAPSMSDLRISNKLLEQIPNNVTGKLRPISELIPYQAKQTIKAKVTEKSPIDFGKFSAKLQDKIEEFTITGNGVNANFFHQMIQNNTIVIPVEHDEELVTNLDSSQAYSYSLKECYIASVNGIDRFDSYGTVIDVCTAQCPYTACFKCQKKVTKNKSGNYSCSRCKESFIPVDKVLLTINIGDINYVLQKLVLFDKVVEKFLEVKIEDITRYVQENNANYWKIFSNVIYKPYQFELKNKNQQNDPKYRTLKTFQVVSVEKPNYKQRCVQLLTEIESMYTFWRAYVQYIIEKRLKDLSTVQNLEQ